MDSIQRRKNLALLTEQHFFVSCRYEISKIIQGKSDDIV